MMDDDPLILGIHHGQDAGVCLMHGARVLWAIQKERLTRQRHARGSPDDLRDLYLPQLAGLERPLDIVVECGASSRDGAGAQYGETGVAGPLVLSRHARRAHVSPHLAQAHGAFHGSPFRDAAVLVVGGRGRAMHGPDAHAAPPGALPGAWRQVAEGYRVDRERAALVGKGLWNGDADRPAGLGMFYFLLTQVLFPGAGNEDRVMDLAPYGDPHALGLPPLAVDGMQVDIPAAWQALLGEHGRFRFGAPHASFTDCANLAAAGQRAFEDALLALAHWLHRQTGVDNLCLTGGGARNCRANGRLLREGPFRQVVVPPSPGAAGAALGCALYGLTELGGRSSDFRWSHAYLGPAPQLADIEAALDGADDLIVEHPRGRDALCARMLDLLCSGRVIGLYLGRSEYGPRALGHRSILADPRRERMRDWLNARVKERDWFRPLAPIVADEHAARYFDVAAPSPHMGFSVPVRSSMAPLLGAVTHVDGSARLQTVGPSDEPVLRALLAGFEVRTGVPVLLNTSLSGRDEPLVETPQQAVATFRRLPLHGLAMPPYLVMKRHEPGLPA